MNEERRFVNCYTSNGGTSVKQRKARRWGMRTVIPCWFCDRHPTSGDWMRHIIAKHAPEHPVARELWVKAFVFGEVESARNCTNGSARRMEAA